MHVHSFGIGAALMVLAASGCGASGPSSSAPTAAGATAVAASDASESAPATSSATSEATAPSSSEVGAVSSDDQTVMVHLALSGDGFGTEVERQQIFELEDALTSSIERAGVGEFDGDGFGQGGADLFAYGPDADALYAAMEADIRAYGPAPGSYVLLIYGSDPDAPERTIELP